MASVTPDLVRDRVKLSAADIEDAKVTEFIKDAEAIYKEATDAFTVRVASKPDEIKALLEVGFEFGCEKDELLYFRKRK